MQKQIRGEIIKMAIVVVGLIAVTIFAWNFVYTGIMAKVALNGSIIGVFVFGIYLCFKNTLALKNEQTAFSALVETYEDIKRNKVKGAEDPYWAHYRCLEPGTVFARPHLLGHFFELVYDEMFRSKRLKVSVETMSGLVHGVESRLREERSVIGYMTGLLVFMGLIGAFIGLIQMVGSVGDLLGSLATAGGSSAGMAKLIADLQAPLKGMSVGFSSSLFGLFGSMTLGLLNQFSSHAGTILKTEFEAWLASAAQIDEDGEHGADEIKATPETPAIEALMAAAAGFSRAQSSVDQVAKVMTDIARSQNIQGEALMRTTQAIEEMSVRHEEMAKLIAASGAVVPALVGTQQEMIAASRGVEGRIVSSFEKLEKSLFIVQQSQVDSLGRLEHRSIQTAGEIIAAVERTGKAQVEAIKTLPTGSAVPGDATGTLAQAQALEAGMQQGFSEVARAIETSFLAYARLLETSGHNREVRIAAAVEPPSAADPVPLPIAVGQSLAPPDNGPQVDAAEMLRRLQSAVSMQYRQRGA